MISPDNALKLAIWLAHAHPAAFRDIARRVGVAEQLASKGLSGGRFGAAPSMGCAPMDLIATAGNAPAPIQRAAPIPTSNVGTQAVMRQAGGGIRRGPMYGYAGRGPFGYFGDDTIDVPLMDMAVDPGVTSTPDIAFPDMVSSPDIPEITVTAGNSFPDMAPVTPDLISGPDPVLSPIGVDSAAGDVPPISIDSTPSGSGDSSFWSSLGSALGTAATGAVSIIGSVGKALTSPQTVQAAGQIAAANIRNTQQQQVAAQQQAILAAQLARVRQGYAPAPIAYVPNAAGQQIPMYYNSRAGQYQATPVTPSVLQSILPSSLASSGTLPWLLLGGGAIIVALLASRRTT